MRDAPLSRIVSALMAVWKAVEQDLARLGLRQIAQYDRIVQIDRLRKQAIANEGPNLRIKKLIAADKPKVFQKLAREESDNGTPVARAVAVELDRMIHLGFQHGLKDNFARFFRREGLYRQFGIAESGRVQFAQVLIFAIEATREARQGDIQRVQVFARGIAVDFDDKGILPLAPAFAAHRRIFEAHAFVLDRLRQIP